MKENVVSHSSYNDNIIKFGYQIFNYPIFVGIFEPPIIHVIGFLISDVTFFKAFISFSNCNPAKEGKNSVPLFTDA